MAFIRFAIFSIHKNCFHFIIHILNNNNNNNNHNDDDDDDDDNENENENENDNENNCTKIL